MSSALAHSALPAALGALVGLALGLRIGLSRGRAGYGSASRRRSLLSPAGRLEPLVLFTSDTPNGKKVSVLLEELGLPYRVASISLDRKEQHSAAFLRISPNNKVRARAAAARAGCARAQRRRRARARRAGQIPAIIDPNYTDPRTGEPLSLFESGAIMLYLGGQYGCPSLLGGPSGAERLRCLEWLFFQVSGLGPAPGQLHHFLPRAGLAELPPSKKPLPAPPAAEYAYVLARFDGETRRLYGVLDTRLAQTGAYVAGEHYSVADIALWCWTWRAPKHKVDLEAYPAVRAWFERIAQRPAVQRGLRIPTAEQMARPRLQPVPELEGAEAGAGAAAPP